MPHLQVAGNILTHEKYIALVIIRNAEAEQKLQTKTEVATTATAIVAVSQSVVLY